MLNSIQDKISHAVQTFGKIPFLFGLIAIEVYILVNGAAWFPQWDTSYQSLILFYLVMTCAFGLFIYIRRKQMIRTQEELGINLNVGILSFAVGFFITVVLLAILVKIGLMVVDTNFPKSIYFETIIIQICVVATSEELIFRGIFLDVFQAKKWTGIIITSVLFSLWHSYAYQVVWYQLDWSAINIGSLMIAFIFSVILCLIARRKATEDKIGGLSATIGIHAAWNICVIGALPIGTNQTPINIVPVMIIIAFIGALILIPIMLSKKRKGKHERIVIQQ